MTASSLGHETDERKRNKLASGRSGLAFTFRVCFEGNQMELATLKAVPMLFHYAAWATLPAIVSDGYLQPSNAGAEMESPLLWFSADQRWEATATKMVSTRNGTYQMTFAEQQKHFGCIRFSLPADDPRLMSWPTACKVAGTKRAERRRLEAAGRKRGADHNQWFAMAEPVSIGSLALEVFLDEGWQLADPVEMARLWTRARSR